MSYKRNGYIMIYMPSHHRAGKDGMVYEHIYLAEKYIGRDIMLGEDVHHMDEDRSNNSEENLIVFKTHEDHSRFHKTGVKHLANDGAYVSPKIFKSKLCIHCKNVYQYIGNERIYCSQDCAKESTKRAERPSKEELEILIRTTSFKQIGKNYNVSDNAVRKWCKSYDLPYRKKDIN